MIHHRALLVAGVLLLPVAFAPLGVTAPPLLPSDVRVIDGDTLDMAGERVRLLGVDTPEVFSPACDRERMLGLRASGRVAEIVADAEAVSMERHGTDRYRRTLAVVYFDGDDLGARLVAEGHAKVWPGRKVDWCS